MKKVVYEESLQPMLYEHEMYEINVGGYQGVAVPKHVMLRLRDLSEIHNRKVLQVLKQNIDEIVASHWTCESAMDDKGGVTDQAIVRYCLEDEGIEEVKRRLDLFKVQEPPPVKHFFKLRNNAQASKIAGEILNQIIEIKKQESEKAKELSK